MLSHPLFDKLSQLRLPGFRAALEEQLLNPQYAELSFEERLTFLVDRECTRRQNNRLQRNLKAAHLSLQATIEDLDFSPSRGIQRQFILELAQNAWIHHHLNTIIIGPTGVGKSYLACALGHAASRQGFSVRYHRASRLLHAITLAHVDGSYAKSLDALARVQLLILDDWLRDPLSLNQTHDLLEVLDDRHLRSSTLIASQIPVEDWHARFPDPTLADAVLDRLVHNAYRIQLKGESQRKLRSPLTMSST
jgi:DNA replication protein DnaC